MTDTFPLANPMASIAFVIHSMGHTGARDRYRGAADRHRFAIAPAAGLVSKTGPERALP
jgi:hypothetical protein